MRYTLGVDFGGGASKATLLREDGVVAATSTSEYPTSYPHIGWAEQNPDDWFKAFLSNVKNILRTGGISSNDIECIAFDGGTHVAVLLDKDENVIRPAIYWTDRRSVKEAEYLNKEHVEIISSLALNTPNPLWTLPQLLWLKENEPQNFTRIDKIMFLKDYVRYLLTGAFVTDSIEAMGSLLMDVNNSCWSGTLCDIAGISREILPEIVEPSDIIGKITSAASELTGLSENTKVIAGATDTVMEVYASGAIKKGQATVKLATAGRICSITDEGVVDPLLVNYKHVVPGLWYPGTATKSCAASYRWYRDVLCTDEIKQAEAAGTDPYIIMSDAAAEVPPGSDNLYFHPYLEGEITPYLDNDLRASFTGVSGFHTKGHFSRAVMEGVSYSLKECRNAMKELNMDVESASIIGGGAKSPLWRQITADILELPLTKLNDCDSSLGSAMLAGVAVGMFESFKDSVEKCIKIDVEVTPDPHNSEIYRDGFKIYKKIHDAMAPIYHEIAGR